MTPPARRTPTTRRGAATSVPRCVTFALAIALTLAGPARADCESGIASLVTSLAGVADPHLHALVESDLRRAQFELWEFDEVECAVALQHAARLIRFGA